jgi:hypothetical protein
LSFFSISAFASFEFSFALFPDLLLERYLVAKVSRMWTNSQRAFRFQPISRKVIISKTERLIGAEQASATS